MVRSSSAPMRAVLLYSMLQILPQIVAWAIPPSCHFLAQSNSLLSKGISTSRLEALCDDSSSADEQTLGNLASRRDIIKFSSIFLASSGASMFDTRPAAAAASKTDKKSTESGVVNSQIVADRLRVVSTFTIVDMEGVPYMVVGEDAKATGYFFTTYGEAKRILKLANDSAEKGQREALSFMRKKRKQEKLPPMSASEEKEEIGTNPWASARISTVPLDFAVTLVTKSESSGTSRGRALFKVAPAETDISDALALDKSGKDELAEGKVPLFYFENFEKESNGEKQSPLYFRKAELVQDWKKQNPSKELPEMLVTELFSVVREMIQPGGTDQDLKTVVFVPPKENAKKAEECIKVGGTTPAFLIGKTNIVL